MKKVCFVAMGFGKKTDYQNSKEVDLDRIYSDVIKPLFKEELQDYKLVRADEIAGSALIDVSMYALLLNSDLVIADITTLNSNAIYELGIRHAVKPFSTIIMAQESCKVPFDLDHSRFLKYKDYGEYLDDDEANVIRKNLKSFIKESEKKNIDSPLYTFLPKITPPTIEDDLFEKLMDEVESKTDTISMYVDKAKELMDEGYFEAAIEIWKKLEELLPSNEFIVQQLSLALYKAKIPSETKALELALDKIKELKPEKSLNFETLGITGAIYKRLYRLNNNFDYLDEAIEFYKKGYVIKNDYYNGENYSNCLLLKTLNPEINKDDIMYLKYESKKVYGEIINIIKSELKEDEINFWMFATLSISHFVLGDMKNFEKYQKKFLEQCNVEWQQNTYFETVEELKVILNS